ncbi:DUF4302 domain-containing protein [Carboxylicivirga taeanensis]|uniref:DUF4302 domain-containing protein n=1 Tax=Carboxylicivirga taeanensis TaxID=1416875 RepID=UPI003F6DC699
MRARYFIYTIVTLLLAACQDNSSEYMFDKSVNERFDEKKKEFIEIFNTPEFGWIGNYNRNGDVGSHVILFKFIENNQVVLQSDYRYKAKNDTITYRIDKTLKIELVFESHSVLHEIYEINNNDSGGEFVFNITSANENEVVLTSKTDNGYNGEEVTELILNIANEDNWDLGPLYESEVNLIGDPMNYVFRNIQLDGSGIADFSYDRVNRVATVSFMENGNVVEKAYPINITAEGFNFIQPLVIAGITIKGFIFNMENESFEDTESGAVLIYGMEPIVPLPFYDFGVEANAIRYNYLEPNKSSQAWNQFYTSYTQSLADIGLELERIYIRDLRGDQPYLHIYTNIGIIWYDVNYEVKEDGKVYFTLTGATNAPSLTPYFEPLFEVIVGSVKGYYIRNTGGLLSYSNGTVSLINADNPSFEINYYDF